jgi:NTP pyrophosphatase (non-canonical NTP hydrolase)
MSNSTVAIMLRGLFTVANVKSIEWLDGKADTFSGAWGETPESVKEGWRTIASLTEQAMRASFRTLTHSAGRILEAIYMERERQEKLKAEGRFAFTCADSEMSNPERLTVLGEEFGEVCHEVNEGIGEGRKVDKTKLRKELVQVAAVCMAWIEAIDQA